MRVLTLAILVVAICATATALEKEAPWFCRGVPCPDYKVKEHWDNTTEVRSYKESVWVAQNTTGSLTLALTKGYFNIERYLLGDNKPGLELKSGRPTTVGFYTKAKFAELQDEKVVATYLPGQDELSAPDPLKDGVFIYAPPPHSSVAVKSFGGFATESSAQQTAGKLAELLDKEGYQYDEDFFVLAIYDPPARLINRHNEIWIPLMGKEAVLTS